MNLFLTGLDILFYQYLIMLLPIYGQKLFNDLFVRWGLNGQYSIEFVPILTIAAFSLINDVKNIKKKTICAYIIVLVTIIVTISTLDNRVSKWYKPEQERFYQKSHYVRNFDVEKTYRLLKTIPNNASVSAQSMLVPHLAFRDYIYHYPYIGDAEYVVLLTADNNKYPLTKKQYDKNIADMKASAQWKIFYKDKDLIIFKRL